MLVVLELHAVVAFVVRPGRLILYLGISGVVFSRASVVWPLLGGVFSDQLFWKWRYQLFDGLYSLTNGQAPGRL